MSSLLFREPANFLLQGLTKDRPVVVVTTGVLQRSRERNLFIQPRRKCRTEDVYPVTKFLGGDSQFVKLPIRGPAEIVTRSERENGSRKFFQDTPASSGRLLLQPKQTKLRSIAALWGRPAPGVGERTFKVLERT